MTEQGHNLEEKQALAISGRVPEHVAIIMDGNGRWAQSHDLLRSAGHSQGVGSVHNITEIADSIGVKYITLYTFSTENWNRPAEEIDFLMNLIGHSIDRELQGMIENNVRLRLIGDWRQLPEHAQAKLAQAVEATSGNTGLVLSLCLSYSSRWEITRAAQILAREAAAGLLNPDDISDFVFAQHLDTAGIPDPDLLIRTGGELRISNFLLWQIAYSELYFTDVLWPDFGKEQFLDAILDFQRRERRFGLTGDQIRSSAKE